MLLRFKAPRLQLILEDHASLLAVVTLIDYWCVKKQLCAKLPDFQKFEAKSHFEISAVLLLIICCTLEYIFCANHAFHKGMFKTINR